MASAAGPVAKPVTTYAAGGVCLECFDEDLRWSRAPRGKKLLLRSLALSALCVLNVTGVVPSAALVGGVQVYMLAESLPRPAVSQAAAAAASSAVTKEETTGSPAVNAMCSPVASHSHHFRIMFGNSVS
jgi:hypothetical protein